MNRWMIASLLFALVGTACSEPDTTGDQVQAASIYRDYKVWADEAGGIVTIRLQFRRGGRNGTSITLGSLAEARLDGEKLASDSIGKIGTFYEIQKEVLAFEGMHTISFRDERGKVHVDSFNYSSINISEVPPELKRENLDISIEGAPDGTPVHVILTDTSFLNDDFNQIDTVRNGQLSIPAIDLYSLRNGPVQLQLIRSEDRLIRESGKISGHLSLSYSLQREASLVSQAAGASTPRGQ